MYLKLYHTYIHCMYYKYKYMYVRIYVHLRMYAYAHMYMYVRTYIDIIIRTCTLYIRMYTHIIADTQDIHTHTHTKTHTHTHTHIHTHTIHVQYLSLTKSSSKYSPHKDQPFKRLSWSCTAALNDLLASSDLQTDT